MLPRQRRGFFLSEYTIRVILLLVVAMIVIKFCSDMIDLRTENNPAVRSRNAVKGIAEAIGEVDKCSPSGVPSSNELSLFADKSKIIISSDPKNLLRPYSVALGPRIDEIIVDNLLLDSIGDYIKNNPDDSCFAIIPFSFDFDNWYFSINSREDPSDSSKNIAVVSFYEKIPDGFSLDWTSGDDIKIGSSLLLNDGGGINSDEIIKVVELLKGGLIINLDGIGVIKVEDTSASPASEKILIFVEGEMNGVPDNRVRLIVT